MDIVGLKRERGKQSVFSLQYIIQESIVQAMQEQRCPLKSAKHDAVVSRHHGIT